MKIKIQNILDSVKTKENPSFDPKLTCEIKVHF